MQRRGVPPPQIERGQIYKWGPLWRGSWSRWSTSCCIWMATWRTSEIEEVDVLDENMENNLDGITLEVVE